MLRGPLEYMLQMSTIQLNAACKVVDDWCTFLLGDQKHNLYKCYELQISCPSRRSGSFENVLKMNFLLYFAWTILKDLVH